MNNSEAVIDEFEIEHSKVASNALIDLLHASVYECLLRFIEKSIKQMTSSSIMDSQYPVENIIRHVAIKLFDINQKLSQDILRISPLKENPVTLIPQMTQRHLWKYLELHMTYLQISNLSITLTKILGMDNEPKQLEEMFTDSSSQGKKGLSKLISRLAKKSDSIEGVHNV